jgi:drug/metabolite transporter (DMT)-like permease
MLLQSLASAALLLVWTAFSGELVEGIYQCQRDPRILIALLSWAISNMAGIVVMLRIVGEFSAVTAVVLSLVRKIFSLFVSYAFFPKVFNGGHAVGLLLVFFSVVLHSFRRQFFALLDTYTSQTDAGKLARPAISDDDVAMHHMQTTKA